MGNTKTDNLQRLLIIQKRCARVILNAGTERAVGPFKRGWIPISDILEQKKLSMGNGLITLIIIFVMLKIDIVTQLGRQLIWTYPHFSLAL